MPPSIQVMGNQWNLVPVISLLPLEKIPMGSALDADTYLGTENWTEGLHTSTGAGGWAWCPTRTPYTSAGTLTRRHGRCPIRATMRADDATITEDNEGACGTQDPGNAGTYFTRDVAGQTDDVVEIGRGYWVWFTKDGTITP